RFPISDALVAFVPRIIASPSDLGTPIPRLNIPQHPRSFLNRVPDARSAVGIVTIDIRQQELSEPRRRRLRADAPVLQLVMNTAPLGAIARARAISIVWPADHTAGLALQNIMERLRRRPRLGNAGDARRFAE